MFCLSLLSSTKHADSIDLELEVDPLNVDHFSCTPLVSSNLLHLIKATQTINHVACESTNFFAFLKLLTFLLRFFYFFLWFFPPDVGVCTGPPRGSSGPLQMGQACPGHPRFSRAFAALNCAISRTHKISRMPGTATKGRAAAAGHFATYITNVLLPRPRCPDYRQLDGQLAKQQCGHTQWQKRRAGLHNNRIQHYKSQSRQVRWFYPEF